MTFNVPCQFVLIQNRAPHNMFFFVRQHPESGIPYYQYVIQHLYNDMYLVMSLDKVMPILRYFCTLKEAKEFIRNTEGIRRIDIPIEVISSSSSSESESESDTEWIKDTDLFKHSVDYYYEKEKSELDSNVEHEEDEEPKIQPDPQPEAQDPPKSNVKGKEEEPVIKQRPKKPPSKLQLEYREFIRNNVKGKRFPFHKDSMEHFKSVAKAWKNNQSMTNESQNVSS